MKVTTWYEPPSQELDVEITVEDITRATANTFRQCAEVTFGVMPFPRKFHWENVERVHHYQRRRTSITGFGL